MYSYTSLLNKFTDIRQLELPQAQEEENTNQTTVGGVPFAPRQSSHVRKIIVFVCNGQTDSNDTRK